MFILMLVVLAISVGMVFYKFVSPTTTSIENDKITTAALARARDALIGYAAGQKDSGSYPGGYRPGELPCPDTNNDGSEETSCNTQAQRIGRLPWKKLGLPDLRDGAGERLWYAVSDVFKNSSQTGVLNSDTPGDFTVTGTSPTTSNAIAIVFAPGAALGSQVRDTTNENNVANYLEGENANGDTIFTTALASDTFNDRLLAITRDTFFPPVEQRVARGLRQSIQSYYSSNRYYPFPSALTSTACTQSTYRGQVSTASCPPMADLTLPNWFTPNNWQEVMIYAVAPRCTPKLNSSGGSWITTSSVTANNCPWPTSTFWTWTYCANYSVDSTKRDCNNTAFGSNPYLTVTGVSSSVEALILSAGYGFTGQTRPCTVASSCLEDSENYDVADNYVYVTPTRSSTDNDQMVIVAP